MKYIEPFRDMLSVRKISDEIIKTSTKTWNIMEICGGQTHSIIRNSLDEMLQQCVRFIHGPGCPVCVTPAEMIDKAVELAISDKVTLCCFGDIMKVPGTKYSLAKARSLKGRVKYYYAPLEALEFAKSNPDKEIVFFLSGFETTAPITALLMLKAREEKISNFSVLACHFLVPPAIDALMQIPELKIDALLAAGHVCTISGTESYRKISEKYKIPVIITGFEPADIILAVKNAVNALENKEYCVINQYKRSVKENGNIEALKAMETVLEVSDQEWRGLGTIPSSGLRIRKEFDAFNASKKFTIISSKTSEEQCPLGKILSGLMKPSECPFYAKTCTPANPIGAPMVSSEGACAAYFSR
ncbi:MAG: hydrogenase formation protein HypD [Candidatus Riflebacteria bacterium]|nr:hydrogenase formation protein HypD [Candidatus Riflebacteria bacterium]